MKISYSAPAKVIFSGEHAVVYGKPAFVSALNLRLKFTLWPSKKQNSDETILTISKLIKNYLKEQKIKFSDQNFNYQIVSDIPVSRGLGSSAALSVAAAACFLTLYCHQKFSRRLIDVLAYQIEKFFHKNPSGVDNCVSFHGGLIYYRKEFEFLKNFTKLKAKIPKEIENKLYLIDTGKPEESTKEMIQKVKTLFKNKKKQLTEILSQIEENTKNIVKALILKNHQLLIDNLWQNEINLEKLGVVSSKTKKLLVKLHPYGRGKITGAGGQKQGSGFLIFYAKNNNFEKFCQTNQLKVIKFQPSYLGLKKEL
ncbi:MAG: hypothetical protein QHH09_01430 [Microgenomates group bacterium]|nr:hypothetical protein [Microgenomates group bacterium]